MRIAVVGSGYVGCVTAACLSRDGHAVVAVDTDPSKVQSLRDGICPVVYPALEELVDPPPFLAFGSDRPEAARAAAESFAGVPGPRHFLALESALPVKYASNAFHGMKIAFANEMGSLCAAAGASPIEVMKVFCEDTSLNISQAYLRPGFAF